MNTRTHATLAIALLALAGAAPAGGQEREARPPRAERRISPVPRGWIGIAYRATVEEEDDRRTERMVVDDVHPGSPAARAGVQAGDTVLSWNGDTRVAAGPRRLAPGDTVRLRVWRDGRTRDLTMVAAERPRDLPRPGGRDIDERGRVFLDHPDVHIDRDSLHRHFEGLARHADSLHRHLSAMMRDSLGPHLQLRMREMEDGLRRLHFDPPHVAFDLEIGSRAVAGAEFSEMNPGLASYFGTERGALVLRVAPGTPASRAGLQAGDVVVTVNGEPVEELGMLRRAIRRSHDRGVDLLVVRKGQRRTLRMSWE